MTYSCAVDNCPRAGFKSKHALRMHLMRGHGWNLDGVDTYLATLPKLSPAPFYSLDEIRAAEDEGDPYVVTITLEGDEIGVAQACAYIDEHEDVASMIAAWLTDSLAKFAELPSVKLALEARRVNDVEVA